MQFITQKLHGFVDYAAAVGLIVLPFILGLAEISALGHWISVAAGAGLILYSLITDYSMSARRLISYNLHLFFDLAAGVTFLVLPFVLGFEGLLQGYYLVMGAAVVLVVLLSDRGEAASDAVQEA
jgi:uncharacterized membrane protein YhaH (DUF805 family)